MTTYSAPVKPSTAPLVAFGAAGGSPRAANPFGLVAFSDVMGGPSGIYPRPSVNPLIKIPEVSGTSPAGGGVMAPPGQLGLAGPNTGTGSTSAAQESDTSTTLDPFSRLADLLAMGYGAQPAGPGQNEITGSYPIDQMQQGASSGGSPLGGILIVLAIGVAAWFAYKHFHKG